MCSRVPVTNDCPIQSVSSAGLEKSYTVVIHGGEKGEKAELEFVSVRKEPVVYYGKKHACLVELESTRQKLVTVATFDLGSYQAVY